MHILIIEDEEETRREMTDFLENSLHRVTAFTEFEHIIPQIFAIRPDIILLDLNLPGRFGFDICTEIRKSSDVPIIYVTGCTDSMDEVTAFLKGGDDYITKPFHPSLLLAHINAVLKRTQRGKEELKMECGGVELDLARGCIRHGGESRELTKNELKILSCLFLHRGEIVSRRELIDYLWDNAVFIDDNSLSVHVTRIRGKLEELGAAFSGDRICFFCDSFPLR
ncbi:MAG: response regulator transcription factor [Lachnospiraceae bacterium]|nr:response regulator transcription factor [uncultured Acetatifactor sp.]MCI8287330.1 response regulator transcription factor [Lachnospiraceae bacterium]